MNDTSRPLGTAGFLMMVSLASAGCMFSPSGSGDPESNGDSDPAEEVGEVAQGLAIDCSTVNCTSADQTLIGGFSMFSEANFAAIVDGFGRTRKFFVHIPAIYDALPAGQKVPVIFAFHGGGQTREAMIDGKWGDFFNQEIAFVVPLGEPDPCDNVAGTGISQWMQPGVGVSTSPGNASCDAATQVVTVAGTPRTYWNANLPGSFTDVLFVEELRAMVLSRFPNLNADKVYATGFSSGGGLTFTLACYRSSLFRGFSVAAKTLGTDGARGDFDQDGIFETDPLSLVATCGKNTWDAAHATGISAPELWGQGIIQIPGPLGNPKNVPVSRAKPVALFAGDQDNTMQEINDTGDFVRVKNNLTGGFFLQNPFLDNAVDQATTQRRTFKTAADPLKSVATFRRFLVQGVAGVSATHAMPDAQECGAGANFMTCDYSYTDQTKIFFEEHADLSLLP